MMDPKGCCGLLPKAEYDHKAKKWYFKCGVCDRHTTGHSARKKAMEAWNKMVSGGGAGDKIYNSIKSWPVQR